MSLQSSALLNNNGKDKAYARIPHIAHMNINELQPVTVIKLLIIENNTNIMINPTQSRITVGKNIESFCFSMYAEYAGVKMSARSHIRTELVPATKYTP